jgi:hypothetical protein
MTAANRQAAELEKETGCAWHMAGPPSKGESDAPLARRHYGQAPPPACGRGRSGGAEERDRAGRQAVPHHTGTAVQDQGDPHASPREARSGKLGLNNLPRVGQASRRRGALKIKSSPVLTGDDQPTTKSTPAHRNSRQTRHLSLRKATKSLSNEVSTRIPWNFIKCYRPNHMPTWVTLTNSRRWHESRTGLGAASLL